MTEVAKPNRKAMPMDLTLAENKEIRYVHTPPAGTTIEEMLNPQYWAHVATQLRPGAIIVVWGADGALWAELLVWTVAPFAAKVEALRSATRDLPRLLGAVVEEVEGYEFKHRGGGKWSVLRTTDSPPVFIKDGLPGKVEASIWLKQYIAQLG
jgi:hypothetical protein